MPLITMEDITLRVGQERLFHHTNWTVSTDQHWAILGPNGSGKSTLAGALFHRATVVAGRILYFFGDGHPRTYCERGDVVRISTEDHRALTLGQSGYHQARWQSIEGKDVPKVSEWLNGPLKVPERVCQGHRKRIVALLGIEHILGRKLIHLSNGEMRKALIAKAMMQSPKLMIFDDPFIGLDEASRTNLRTIIDQLLTDGDQRILFVTSNAGEIPQGITHVLCVADARIVAKGPKDEILSALSAHEVFRQSEPMTAAPMRCPPPVFPPSIPFAPTLIEMKNSSVSYGGTQVLHGVDWTVRKGENWALLGPNGSGKTTLLSLILADNLQAYTNDIRLFGRKRGTGESIWEVKQNIGWVSPELMLHYKRDTTCHGTVCSGFFDSVGFYRVPTPEQARRAEEWMDRLGIEELMDRPLRSASAGEQRLVLIARALVKDPPLLILDEPCQGLDQANRNTIIDLLDRFCKKKTIHLIYVTHHQEEMPRAISHVLRLEKGRVSGCGPR